MGLFFALERLNAQCQVLAMGNETVLLDPVAGLVATSGAMLMPKAGSRRIVVDGTPFRWRVRSRPTYCQGNAWSPLTVAVEREAGGAVLVLVFAGARPDNWMGESTSVATPAAVASAIRGVSEAGWESDENGGPAFFGIATGRLASSMGGVSTPHNDAVAWHREGDWQPYDPEWLVSLAKDQHPDAPWLPGSLRACRQVRPETRAYVHFVDPATPAWRFQGNIVLESPEQGTLVLDILEGELVGGVEFLNRL